MAGWMKEPRPRGAAGVLLPGAGPQVLRVLPHQAALQDQAHPELANELEQQQQQQQARVGIIE